MTVAGRAETKNPEPIRLGSSVLLFLLPGIWFWFIQNRMVPRMADTLGWSPYVAWLLAGSLLLFGPLFALTFILLKRDGYKLDWSTIASRLRIRRVTGRDLLWILGGFAVSSLLVGLIVTIWALSPLRLNLNDLRGASPIDVKPLVGAERYALMALPVLFFFNYVGEEILWRGYILPRQEVTLGRHAWIVNGLLHLVFHLSFQFSALVVSLPFLLMIPFVAQRTKSTSNTIIIHALLGAPIQILAALGLAS